MNSRNVILVILKEPKRLKDLSRFCGDSFRRGGLKLSQNDCDRFIERYCVYRQTGGDCVIDRRLSPRARRLAESIVIDWTGNRAAI